MRLINVVKLPHELLKGHLLDLLVDLEHLLARIEPLLASLYAYLVLREDKHVCRALHVLHKETDHQESSQARRPLKF
ncbi:hypothetical protein HYQ46_006176 [Verticillium longisporum]|nr:hypothetical protein HYQ46_006176 [Verticillium longisporum]